MRPPGRTPGVSGLAIRPPENPVVRHVSTEPVDEGTTEVDISAIGKALPVRGAPR